MARSSCPSPCPASSSGSRPTPGSDRAGLLEVLKPSPDRVAPICPHFGVCGGCALQHLEASAYLAWKRELVVAALRSRGLDAEVDAVRPVPLGSRRRAALALGRGKRGARARLSPRPLARADRRRRSARSSSPRIVASLPKLKQALAPLLGGKREARVSLTETEGGLDIAARRRQAEPRGAWRLCRQGRLRSAWRGSRSMARASARSPRRRSICPASK